MNTTELALKEAQDAVERGVSLHPVTVERLLREIERLTAQAEASRLNAKDWMEVATDLRKVTGRIHEDAKVMREIVHELCTLDDLNSRSWDALYLAQRMHGVVAGLGPLDPDGVL